MAEQRALAQGGTGFDRSLPVRAPQKTAASFETSGALGSTPARPDDRAGRAAKLAEVAIIAARHGLWDQAIMALQQAHGFVPEDTGILLELGYAFAIRRRYQEALIAYQRIVALRPDWPTVYANLGALLIHMGKPDLAVAASRIGISLDPTLDGGYINLASALRFLGDYEEACKAYYALLARVPHHAAGLADSFYLRQHLCELDGWQNHLDLVLAHTFRKGHRVPVFSVLVASPYPADHLLAARVWVKPWCADQSTPLAPYVPRPEGQRTRRLKIGYLSNDFYNHATALLLVELLELRDRDAFEVYGYSTENLDDGTLIRHRIISAFDACYDLKDLTDQHAADKIKEDEIDILVDLKGYTSGARTEIMAFRPAPIQINFLGYPGTMGASFIDYIIADHFILPPGSEPYYDEHIVRMPDSYQPNDRKRPVADEVVTRRDCGLPEDGFVFCSFNAPYKITPQMFEIWMRLLHDVPGSVLWTLEGFGPCDDNLRKEAARHGIPPERLVFAPKRDTGRHLARMRLGDLFLDTLPVNAHTTASDALWVGLPVLTCAGNSLVSRVAGSLLNAVGLPELVTHSLDEYAEMARKLARDPALLTALRHRLDANRLTTPLFDSVRYTRHYEAALLRMNALRDAGEPPRAFAVDPID